MKITKILLYTIGITLLLILSEIAGIDTDIESLSTIITGLAITMTMAVFLGLIIDD